MYRKRWQALHGAPLEAWLHNAMFKRILQRKQSCKGSVSVDGIPIASGWTHSHTYTKQSVGLHSNTIITQEKIYNVRGMYTV